MQIIDGKEISEKIKLRLEDEVKELIKLGKTPKLSVILVGDDYGSSKYVASKEKNCERLGITSNTIRLSEDTSEEKLLNIIDELNSDDTVDAILVQLPLPKHIDTYKVINKISVDKDVDGFNNYNVGKMLTGEDGILPCTPYGIIKLLKAYNIDIKGKLCTVIGRSNIVGKPASVLMLRENATVIMTHSKTQNLENLLKQSDIIIAAIGQPKFVKESMIKEGAVLIDVGINRDDNGKMCGDIDFEECSKKASYITPVPGGVGPMTIAMLMSNCVELAKKRMKK